MGCASSNLFNDNDDFTQLGSSALGQHIVSLTSTTYGLLSLDHPPPSPSQPLNPATPPPRRFTFGSIFASPLSGEIIKSSSQKATTPSNAAAAAPPEPSSVRSEPEVINSWELMAGLDADSFRFSPIPPPSRLSTPSPIKGKASGKLMDGEENSDPNKSKSVVASGEKAIVKPFSRILGKPSSSGKNCSLDGFERRCPPNGESRVVVYTTSLRGVRQTFEACTAVVAALEGLGFWVCQRDISMDRGFREELRELMKGRESGCTVPPRVFVKGRYVGGAEEVLKIAEEGLLGVLLEGLPKIKAGAACEGCGGVRFLPCFRCDGSCKMVMRVKEKMGPNQGRNVVVRCPDCNENGLVLCPICS